MDHPTGRLLLIHDILNKAHQDGCDLGSRGAALRQELAVGAVDDFLSDCPLHRILGIAADLICIREIAQIAALARVDALLLRIP